MSLYKKEVICSNCDKQFILVLKIDDKDDLLSCPFCTTVIPDDEEEKEELQFNDGGE